VIADDGSELLGALQQIDALDHTGWASTAAASEDLTLLCPGAWIQPGAVDQRSEAGRGQHTRAARTWLVVITVSGIGDTPLELTASPLVEAVRTALTGLRVGTARPQRRVRYVSEGEPFYAPGYIELPLEFELSETFSGDTQ